MTNEQFQIRLTEAFYFGAFEFVVILLFDVAFFWRTSYIY